MWYAWVSYLASAHQLPVTFGLDYRGPSSLKLNVPVVAFLGVTPMVIVQHTVANTQTNDMLKAALQ